MSRSHLDKSPRKNDVRTKKTIGMSDHLPTMVVRRYKGQTSLNSNQRNTFYYRDTKRLDQQKLVNELRDAPWDAAFVFEDTDDIVDSC